MKPDPVELRRKLAHARLMLIVSPALCGERDPLGVLEAALPWIDVIQVRPKGGPAEQPTDAPCVARETHDWTVRVLDLLAAHPGRRVPVIVDDRVDVAASLWDDGCAGVHVGQDDCPVARAREILGPDPLIGLSTHTMAQVAAAWDETVDYLGFGPVHATSTKGFARGLGSEACWIASQGASVPVFPIGGIDAERAGELEEVGRAAVGSAILAAPDPGRAAREIRALLAGDAA